MRASSHTFNDLHTSGNQVVISSDRPPHGLTRLEDRLRSRFQWGLTADIHVPDLETRMAILASKSEHLGVQVADTVLELIAKRVRRSVRDLEGSLNRMIAESQLMNVPITVQSVARILDDSAPDDTRQSIDPREILEAVAGHYGLDAESLIARGRTKKVSRARQVAMYMLIYELKHDPYPGGPFPRRQRPFHHHPRRGQDKRGDQRRHATAPGSNGHQGRYVRLSVLQAPRLCSPAPDLL